MLPGATPAIGAKPGPGMALAFCEAVGIAPAEAAMVGDAVHDLAMGRAAGFGAQYRRALAAPARREDLEDYADLILAGINDMPARAEFRALT